VAINLNKNEDILTAYLLLQQMNGSFTRMLPIVRHSTSGMRVAGIGQTAGSFSHKVFHGMWF
jgi:hypothetical protein